MILLSHPYCECIKLLLVTFEPYVLERYGLALKQLQSVENSLAILETREHRLSTWRVSSLNDPISPM